MYLSRQDWNAAPARRRDSVSTFARTHLILHSEEMPAWLLQPAEIRGTVRRMQHRDMFDLNMPDLRYNFLLSGSTLVEGRGWDEPGFVMASGLCLCLLGNHSPEALQAFYAEVDYRMGHPLVRQAISEKEVPYV